MIRNVRIDIHEIPHDSDEYRKATHFEQNVGKIHAEFEKAWHESPSLKATSAAAPEPLTKLSPADMAVRERVESLAPKGRSLASWLEILGGYAGQLVGPDGKLYPVSLERWRGRDHNSTIVSISFSAIDTRLVGTKVSDRFPNRA